jgi:hypothetical protein
LCGRAQEGTESPGFFTANAELVFQFLSGGVQFEKIGAEKGDSGLLNSKATWLSLIAYNLGNLWRRLVLPKGVETWSLAVATGEDGRPAGKGCPLLLVIVGREPSDAAPVRKHAAADGGFALPVG